MSNNRAGLLVGSTMTVTHQSHAALGPTMFFDNDRGHAIAAGRIGDARSSAMRAVHTVFHEVARFFAITWMLILSMTTGINAHKRAIRESFELANAGTVGDCGQRSLLAVGTQERADADGQCHCCQSQYHGFPAISLTSTTRFEGENSSTKDDTANFPTPIDEELDNHRSISAVAENFSSYLKTKTEFYHHHNLVPRLAARTALIDYIEFWYD